MTALVRSIPRRLFSNIFPSFGKIALMVFQDNSHVDNGQGSSGGDFDYAHRKLRFRKSNLLVYFFFGIKANIILFF